MQANLRVVCRVFLILVFTCFASCGILGGASSSSDSDSDSDDFSDLTYPEATSLYSETGLAATENLAEFGEEHNTFLNFEPDDTEDVDVLESTLSDYTTALEAATDTIEDLTELNEIVYADVDTSLSLAAGEPLFQLPVTADLEDIGRDIRELADTLATKKAQCEALFAQVPKLPSTPAEFEKLQAARDCVREAKILAVQKGFETAVVNTGGGVTGAAVGAGVVIYMGGSVLSGGGLIVITVAGAIGGDIATYLWSACTGSSSNLVNGLPLGLDDGESCAVSSGKGAPGAAFPLQAIGTGALQVFVEGCAPVTFDGLTVTQGQAINVVITCEETNDDTDSTDVADANSGSTSEIEDPDAVACADVTALTLTTSPSDPGPTDNVTATVSTLAPASGCSVSYSVSGTDGYADSDTLTTDSAGEASFSIPAANEEGIVDTVTVTESASGKTGTVTYVF